MILPYLCHLVVAAASLRVCGSETLGQVANTWSAGWNARMPQVSVETHFPGSGTSLAALAEGTCQVALLSRAPDSAYLRQVEKRIGMPVLIDQVGWDEVVFFVHASNPLRSLGEPQLQRVLGTADKAWRIYGRNALSGTYAWVRARILAGRPFASTTRQLPGPEGVVRAVAADPRGIGYAGREAIHGEVRILELRDAAGAPLHLYRPLFLARSRDDRLAAQFSSYATSHPGQDQLGHCGLIPLDRGVR